MNQRKNGARGSDKGFSLIELLIVIVVLGVLAAIVVFAVNGISDNGQESACQTDERTLTVAVEAYKAQTQSSTIVATGTGPDRYEQTLVSSGYVRETSDYWDVEETGSLTNVSPC